MKNKPVSRNLNDALSKNLDLAFQKASKQGLTIQEIKRETIKRLEEATKPRLSGKQKMIVEDKLANSFRTALQQAEKAGLSDEEILSLINYYLLDWKSRNDEE